MTQLSVNGGAIPRRRYRPRIYRGLVTGEKRDNYWFWYRDRWDRGKSSKDAHETAKQLAGVSEQEFIQPDLFEDLAMRLGLDWMYAGGRIA